MALLWAFFRYTKLGKMMRATAEDQRAAALVGIRIERVFAVTWGIVTCLGAVGAPDGAGEAALPRARAPKPTPTSSASRQPSSAERHRDEDVGAEHLGIDSGRDADPQVHGLGACHQAAVTPAGAGAVT